MWQLLRSLRVNCDGRTDAGKKLASTAFLIKGGRSFRALSVDDDRREKREERREKGVVAGAGVMIELSDFSDSLLCEVLGRFDAPELCALACTCKRFHAFSSILGEDYWRGLVEKRRYLSPHVTPKGKEAWKAVYKESFVKAKLRRQRAHQRKVIVIQMEIQDVNREIKTLKDEANDLINQERAESNLYEEIDRGR